MDCLVHMEAEYLLRRIVANLAHKWEKPYSQTCGYVRARLAFAIIRVTRLCLHVYIVRGSRVKWRSGLRMDDGVPLIDYSCICILEEILIVECYCYNCIYVLNWGPLN